MQMHITQIVDKRYILNDEEVELLIGSLFNRLAPWRSFHPIADGVLTQANPDEHGDMYQYQTSYDQDDPAPDARLE